jgi:hypothetical protein
MGVLPPSQNRMPVIFGRSQKTNLTNAHDMKKYFMMFLTIMIWDINVNAFFYVVGQTLKSLTSSKNYRHPILGWREYN